jgi:hypothetical protein
MPGADPASVTAQLSSKVLHVKQAASLAAVRLPHSISISLAVPGSVEAVVASQPAVAHLVECLALLDHGQATLCQLRKHLSIHCMLAWLLRCRGNSTLLGQLGERLQGMGLIPTTCCAPNGVP